MVRVAPLLLSAPSSRSLVRILICCEEGAPCAPIFSLTARYAFELKERSAWNDEYAFTRLCIQMAVKGTLRQ